MFKAYMEQLRRDLAQVQVDWLQLLHDWLPPLMMTGLAVLLGLVLHRVVFTLLVRLAKRTTRNVDDQILNLLRGPLRMLLVLFMLEPARRLSLWPQDGRAAMEGILNFAWVVALAWLAVKLSRVVEEVLRRRYSTEMEDNREARAVRTQVHVLQRVLAVGVALCALALGLMQFESMRALGTSLLASAGVAGVVVGLAAQKTFASVIAGVQVAFTQPFKLDDVVIVEGEWGRIEEITFTYVVVRIWDQRRLVVPLTYFLETPFQNWTMTTADIMGTVFVECDYTVRVEAVRQELKRICLEDAGPLWDGKVCGLQVTDAQNGRLTLRALVSAGNASKAWDLRCLVREKLVEFLQRQYPQALPRLRLETGPPPAKGAAKGSAEGPAEGSAEGATGGADALPPPAEAEKTE